MCVRAYVCHIQTKKMFFKYPFYAFDVISRLLAFNLFKLFLKSLVCTFAVKMENCTFAVDVFFQICTFAGVVFAHLLSFAHLLAGCLHICWRLHICWHLHICWRYTPPPFFNPPLELIYLLLFDNCSLFPGPLSKSVLFIDVMCKVTFPSNV